MKQFQHERGGYLAGCGKALARPVFSAQKDRRKRHLNGEKTLGYRWETFTIGENEVKEHIEEMVFDFMDKQDLNELILDNVTGQ
jgi:hypothetical protein